MFIMRLNGNFSSIFIMFLAEKSLGEEFDLKTEIGRASCRERVSLM